MLTKPLRTILGICGALMLCVAALAQSELFVTGFSRNKVYAFDSSTGLATRTIGSAAVGLNGPMGMAIDDQNRMYVANQTSGRIMRFLLVNGAVDNTGTCGP
jgi:DNA-binding beta-propeller fold protein YncE